jgi:hypothetical protein
MGTTPNDRVKNPTHIEVEFGFGWKRRLPKVSREIYGIASGRLLLARTRVRSQSISRWA